MESSVEIVATNLDPETSPEQTSPAPRSAMFIVFLVVFIDLLGFGIVLPLLPRFADNYIPTTASTDGTSLVVPPEARGVILGLLYSIFSMMQFVFSPMWGRISDRIGRRPVLLVGLGGSVAFYGLFAFASSLSNQWAWLALSLIFLSRLGAGIAGASISTAAAVIADCTTPEKRSKGMALIGAAFGIGFTFGPLIGYLGLEVLNEAPWAPGAAASFLSLIAFLLAIKLLPETRKPGTHQHQKKQLFSLSRTIEVLRIPTIGTLTLIYFLVIFAFANFEGTLSLLTAEIFGLQNKDNFLVFAYIGMILMIAQGGIYRRMAGKVSEETASILGVGMLLIGMIGIGLVALSSVHQPRNLDGLLGAAVTSTAANPAWLSPVFYIAIAIAVTGFAFVNPSITSLVSKRSDAARQGEVLGVTQSFAALGRILGPLLGLTFFEAESSHTLPYILAVLTLVVVAALIPRIQRKAGQVADAGI